MAALPMAGQAQSAGGSYTQQQINNMVSTAVHIQLKATENDHSVFVYRDHDVQPGKNKYTIVVQTASDGTIHRVTRLNGQAVPISRQKAAVEHFVHSTQLQQKQRKNEEHDAKQVEKLLQMIPKAFLWSVKSESPQHITLSYKPNPSFHPPNMQDRVFAAMAGEMVLDRKEHRIVVFKGRLIHSVKFFFGLIGHMNKGGTFSVRRAQVEHGVWETVSTRTHINGHVLLFKTISQNEDDFDMDFKPAPQKLSLEQAASLAMKQPDWPNSTGSKSGNSSGAGGSTSSSH
jgi:hypothetical protein